MQRALVRKFVIALCLVAAGACATPPDREMQQAQKAIDAARAAGAAKYAPGELEAAEIAMQRAREAVAVKDYRLALAQALDGRERAQLALAQVDAARTAIEAKARQAIERLDTRLDAAKTGTQTAVDSSVVGHATARLQEARAAMERGDFPAALKIADETIARVDAAAGQHMSPSGGPSAH